MIVLEVKSNFNLSKYTKLFEIHQHTGMLVWFNMHVNYSTMNLPSHLFWSIMVHLYIISSWLGPVLLLVVGDSTAMIGLM